VISKWPSYAGNIRTRPGGGAWFISTFAARQEGQWKRLTKPRGISADIQAPRTKLLYFIYSAPSSRIKVEPGVKSSISSALGYKSDGHFHYDWNYLVNASMLEEKQGYFLVTDTGKREFALQSTATMSNSIMIIMGIAMAFFTFGLSLGVLPEESVAFFGVALIFIGSLFYVIGRRNKPELTPEAKASLKELSRH
jgi:hypothetical protein